MAGQCRAIRRDDNESRPPAVHTALRARFVIVRNDIKDTQAVADFLSICGHYRLGPLELLATRDQMLAVQMSPTVELRVGELQILGADLKCQVDNALDVIDIQSMDDAVHHHRES